jgi:acetylornithine deacetylase
MTALESTPELTKVERRVLAAIDVDALLYAVCDLISVSSVAGEAGEIVAQEWVAALLEHAGMSLDVWELDLTGLAQHPSFSVEVERTRGLGVVGSAGSGGGPRLVLNGHVDVVPVADPSRWQRSPWSGTVSDGRVYGRGSVDMKGGLLAGVFAVKAIHDTGVELAGSLDIWSVIGEEDGGLGTLATLLRGHTADAAIIMEPTGLAIGVAQAGCLGFRVSVPGLPAHGCMRSEGVSAVEKFRVIHDALLALEAKRNQSVDDALFADNQLPIPLSIGRVNAGDWASTVPASLTCEGRYGVALGEDLAEARAAFERVVAEACKGDLWLSSHPAEVEWWGGRFASARTPIDHPIVAAVRDALAGAGGPAAVVCGVTYGSDLRLLINDGAIPAVLFGPGDVRVAHQIDEHVPVDQLVTAARTLALTGLRVCGVGAP